MILANDYNYLNFLGIANEVGFKTKNTFSILRKIDGAGNSVQQLLYQQIDDSPAEGLSFYRLKQTDFDGLFSYSPIVSIFNTGGEVPALLYPNPVHSTSVIKFINPNHLITKISIINLQGQVAEEYITISDNVLIYGPIFNGGLYLYQIRQLGYLIGEGKFIKKDN